MQNKICSAEHSARSMEDDKHFWACWTVQQMTPRQHLHEEHLNRSEWWIIKAINNGLLNILSFYLHIMLYILLVCIFLITYLLPNTIFIFFHLHIIIHDIIVIASFVSYNDERPTVAKPRIAIQSKHDLTSSSAYLRPHLQCLLILKNTKTSSYACPDSYSAASLPTHSSV